MKKYFFLLFLLPLCSFKKEDPKKDQPKTEHHKKGKFLHPYKSCSIPVSEPSDICLTTKDPSHYYVVSNRGYIAELTSEGKMVRQTKWDGGSDYEGICIKDGMIYAMDESLRRIDIMDESNFKVKKSLQLTYMGPRNKGFEGLTYIPSEKKFIAVIEKPAMVWELNEQLQVIGQIKLDKVAELSSVTYHDGFLWFLGDEAHEVIKVNPADYHIEARWNIAVDNPEGICFDTNGDMVIVSDDMAMMFKFKI